MKLTFIVFLTIAHNQDQIYKNKSIPFKPLAWQKSYNIKLLAQNVTFISVLFNNLDYIISAMSLRINPV